MCCGLQKVPGPIRLPSNETDIVFTFERTALSPGDQR